MHCLTDRLPILQDNSKQTCLFDYDLQNGRMSGNLCVRDTCILTRFYIGKFAVVHGLQNGRMSGNLCVRDACWSLPYLSTTIYQQPPRYTEACYCSICLPRNAAAVAASFVSRSPNFVLASFVRIITDPMASPSLMIGVTASKRNSESSSFIILM